MSGVLRSCAKTPWFDLPSGLAAWQGSFRPLLLSAFLLLPSVGPVACQPDPDPAAAWLVLARQAHRQADAALVRHDLRAARLALELLLLDPDCRGLVAADCRWLQQDTLFRLSQLELQARRPALALEWAERGLGLGEAIELPSVNLLVSRGQAMEALGRDAEAARDYHRALRISEQLLEQQGREEGQP